MSDKSDSAESLGFSLAAQLAWSEAQADTPALPAAAPQPPAMASLLSSLDRLETVVDQETDALAARKPIDLQDINRRKSRSLLELSRAARFLPETVEPELQDRLLGLKRKLQRNCEVLSMHLDAAREISTILNGALRAAESDGTYTTRLLGGREA
ncbi:hypothetical protein GCM10007301_04100 [Azorhizobium oxalatiphilum]|uniref:Flagellar protein FlgN n=1 Tax=Azorhizobium oxalatiphilum TaxID=980631 RepID=A0A917BLD1_9HYPH|nr:flagellar biosynthesis protein FlgN [Azorhizobium oxalatiphilum]GGF47969.1 hypothetical protein GCM10007301_04100 [Azorhizobium oxalatiphilum]